MKTYIEREAAIKVCSEQYKECLRKSDWGGDTVAWNICFNIKAIPAADVVSRAAFDQVMWERDVAIQQLREDYGVGLGEKKAADVVERKRGEWVEGVRGYMECTECKFERIGIPLVHRLNFCPNCGADMREVEHEP